VRYYKAEACVIDQIPLKGMINDMSDSTMPKRDNCLMKLETHAVSDETGFY